jgi:GrpB-like predicted nucleotidyltransferase (UPF0157 family)
MSTFSKELSRFGLGLEKRHVELRDHDPRWYQASMLLISELQEKVPGAVDCYAHIGSTSIAGICAKPVLDLLGTTSNLESFDLRRADFERIGFAWKGEFGILGRRYLPLYGESGDVAFVHLHVFQNGAPEAAAHLSFRDYLRSHPDAAAEYDMLKKRLAAEHRNNRELYTQLKDEFIGRVLRLAAG